MIYYQYIIEGKNPKSAIADTINEHAKAAGLGLYLADDLDSVRTEALMEISRLLANCPRHLRNAENLQIILTEGEFDHE